MIPVSSNNMTTFFGDDDSLTDPGDNSSQPSDPERDEDFFDQEEIPVSIKQGVDTLEGGYIPVGGLRWGYLDAKQSYFT